MRLNIKSNIEQFKRKMQREQRSQLPFATAKALTATGKAAAQYQNERMPDAFDRPTPFTQKGVTSISATKARMYSRVLVKTIQAAYLATQEEGGTRTPSGRAIVIPIGQRTNKYGNMPKGAVRRALARDDTFSGTVRGIGGIWQRTRAGGVKLLVAYEQQARYKPRFRFKETTEQFAAERFPREFDKAFRQAMETARR